MKQINLEKGNQAANEKKVRSSYKSITFKNTHELIAKYLCKANKGIIEEIGKIEM